MQSIPFENSTKDRYSSKLSLSTTDLQRSVAATHTHTHTVTDARMRTRCSEQPVHLCNTMTQICEKKTRFLASLYFGVVMHINVTMEPSKLEKLSAKMRFAF